MGWAGGRARTCACSKRRRSPAPAGPIRRSGSSRARREYRQGACRRPAARWGSGRRQQEAHDAQVADEVRDEQEDVLARPHIRQRAEAHPATAGAAASVREHRLCRAACADPCNTRHAPPLRRRAGLQAQAQAVDRPHGMAGMASERQRPPRARFRVDNVAREHGRGAGAAGHGTPAYAPLVEASPPARDGLRSQQRRAGGRHSHAAP